MPERAREDSLNYGRTIRSMRGAREMSLEALAEAAGMSASYLSEVERGIKRPSTDVVAKIAEAFGMRPSEFLEHVESQRLPGSGMFEFASTRMRKGWAEREGVFTVQKAAETNTESTKEDLLKMLVSAAGRLHEDELRILIDLARRLAGKPK